MYLSLNKDRWYSMSRTIGLLYPIKEQEIQEDKNINIVESEKPEKVETKKKTTRKPKTEGAR